MIIDTHIGMAYCKTIKRYKRYLRLFSQKKLQKKPKKQHRQPTTVQHEHNQKPGVTFKNKSL